MKFSFRVTLFLSLFLCSWWALSAPGHPLTEAQNNLLALKRLQTQIMLGVDLKNNRYAQSVYAQDMVELLKNHPEVLFNHELMKGWFNLDISISTEYSDIIREYIGLHYLVQPEIGQLFRQLTKSGFIKFLAKAYPNKSSSSAQSSILSIAHEWHRQFISLITNDDLEVREKSLRYIFSSSGHRHEIVQMTENIIKEFSTEQKVRFANDIISHPASTARTLVAHVFLEEISFKELKKNHRTLFSNLLAYASSDIEAARLVSEWLARTPSVANSKLSLTWIETQNTTTAKVVNQYAHFTVVEQLFLLYENYRAQLANAFIIENNGKNGLKLFDLAQEFGIKIDFSMAQALTREFVSKDPRWIEWINEVPEKIRYNLASRLVQLGTLYQGTTDADFALQKTIFNDVRKQAELARQSNPLPPAQFIQGARVNDRLVEKMVESWGDIILKDKKLTTTQAFVKNIFFHPKVDPETRIQWLEVLLNNNTYDLSSLKHLAEGFEKTREMNRDLVEAGRSQIVQIKLLNQILTEIVIDNKSRIPVPFCLRIFQSGF